MTKTFLALLCCATLSAQTKSSDGLVYSALTYANLPAAASSDGKHFRVTDCLTSACTAGGGSTKMDVVSNGSAWVTIGSSSSSGDMLGANNLSDVASAATSRTNLGLVPGTNIQAFDATLLSIALLGTAADRISYTTGVDTWAETPLTAFGRSLIDDAAASNARTTLGLVIATDVLAPNGVGSGLSGIPTSIVGTANEIAASAATSTVTLSLPAVIDLGGKTSLEIPNAAAPTVNVFGQIAGDNNLWASGRGAPVFYDGTAAVGLIGVLVSDTPTNGQVSMWNTGGTITWETLSGDGLSSLTSPNTSISIGGTLSAPTLDVDTAYLTTAGFALKTPANTWVGLQTFGLTATVGGIQLTCGTLPSAPVAGTFACNASGQVFFYTGSAWQPSPIVSTPASATATGIAGTIATDANYVYVCTATDTWKRVSVATW